MRRCKPASPVFRSRTLSVWMVAPLLLAGGACWWLPSNVLDEAGHASTPATGSAEARLVWSDEFEGAELDTTRWEHRGLGPRRDAVNVREAVMLDGNGHLAIVTSRSGGETRTGMIGTQGTFQHTFGYWEARMRFQTQIGHWSAFWLQSPTVGEVGDPRVNGTEIDIIEYLRNQPNIVLNALHWDGYGADHKRAGNRFYFKGLGEGFHRIGLEWTESEYVFYVDDREVWRTREAVSHRPQYAILSLEVGPWAGDIWRATLPDTLFVDYVRVYDRRPAVQP